MKWDSRSALEVAQEFVPDAACLDIGRPGGCRAWNWRADGGTSGREGMLLIAVTGCGQEAGFDHDAVKPVDPPLLLVGPA